MNRLFRAAATTFVLAALTAPSAAAQQQRRGFDIDAYMETLTERLSLTGEQTAEIRPMVETGMAEMRQVMMAARDGGDRQAAMTQMRELGTSTDESIEGVLTAEQIEEYRVFREEQDERMGQRRPPGR